MLLATQSGEDFLDADLLRTVVESCPTKFFLANPNMDLARAREVFHLNHTEAAFIQHLRPRQQALLKRPDLSKVINLHVESQPDGIDTGPDPEPRRAAASPRLARATKREWPAQQRSLNDTFTHRHPDRPAHARLLGPRPEHARGPVKRSHGRPREGETAIHDDDHFAGE